MKIRSILLLAVLLFAIGGVAVSITTPKAHAECTPYPPSYYECTPPGGGGGLIRNL